MILFAWMILGLCCLNILGCFLYTRACAVQGTEPKAHLITLYLGFAPILLTVANLLFSLGYK